MAQITDCDQKPGLLTEPQILYPIGGKASYSNHLKICFSKNIPHVDHSTDRAIPWCYCLVDPFIRKLGKSLDSNYPIRRPLYVNHSIKGKHAI